MASYGYNAKYPTAADVLALAQLLAQRQNDSGLTVFGAAGGIVANGNPTVAPNATPSDDPLTLKLAYMQGIADAILCALAFQAFNEAQALGATSTSSTTFVDIGNGTSTGFSTFTFNAPLAKTYEVRVDVGLFNSVLVATDGVGIQLVNTTTGVTAPNATSFYWPSAANQRYVFNRVYPMAMQAGNNVLKLQWRVGNPGSTVNVDAAALRVYSVRG
jgi:hypothetical protein